MTRRYKRKKTRKLNRKRRKSIKTKKYKGGSGFRAKWVGIPNPREPTGFSWLNNNTMLRPCSN